MCSKPIHWSVAIVVTVLSCVVGGCGGGLLDSLPASREAIPVDVLNQLTAGDLADAFDQFRNGTVDQIAGGQPAGLSDEQRAAIEEMQRQLDAGEISENEFIARVAGALQDTVPNSPFAGFRFLGSPFSAALATRRSLRNVRSTEFASVSAVLPTRYCFSDSEASAQCRLAWSNRRADLLRLCSFFSCSLSFLSGPR